MARNVVRVPRRVCGRLLDHCANLPQIGAGVFYGSLIGERVVMPGPDFLTEEDG